MQTQSLCQAGTLKDVQLLVITSVENVDEQFMQAVSALKLDVSGSLVQRVPLDGERAQVPFHYNR